ncbi:MULTISPECIES: type II secretion system F family protein [unclassified Pseudactinotalea]|uniref:type II secretion system F family protein n=1 Tax=unclassified Pseudactinotalea TaxID=2649176 RepID=UPI00128DEF17|nr:MULTISPECIES: type II secretion system F family protein [unclassified Pseudactinotalea]MPV49888.1 type II secretion system protein F [Pseudactinotalea sp. HY160]QGH69151.1 type II secretion system protein F [Pseudactinotalea sp. HY158]
MGTVTGLLLGAGLVCIWWSCWDPPPPKESAPSSWRARAHDRLTQAGMHQVTPTALAAVSIGLALVVYLGGLALSGSVAVSCSFALMAAAAPAGYVQFRARRRIREVRELWPDVVDDLLSAIRAGMSLPEAMLALADRGPAELRPDFAVFAADYRATGRFSDSLDLLKDRLADPVADRIIEALRLTREVGGTELGRLLRTLSQFLRDDLRTRAELAARQSWTVNGARVAAVAPWIVLALLATRGETARAFDTAAGVVVLVIGAAVTVVAYALMVRIGRLPEDARVLR